MTAHRKSSDQLFEMLRIMSHHVANPEDETRDESPDNLATPYPGQKELYPQSNTLKNTVDELESLYKKYASLFEFTRVGHITLERDGTIREVSLSAAELIGRDRGQLVGQNLSEYLTPKSGGTFHEHLQGVFKDGSAITELELKNSNTECFPIVLESSVVDDARREATLCRAAMLDITEHKLKESALKKALDVLEKRFKKRNRELAKTNASLQGEIQRRKIAEAELSAEKELLSFTLRSMGDAVITTDEKGDVVLMNENAEKITGWNLKRARGKRLSEIFNTFDETTGMVLTSTPVEKVLSDGKVTEELNHTILKDRGGKERIIECKAAPLKDKHDHIIGAVLVIKDVTEAKRIEEERMRGNKLESIGFLAGGIAHDFNNLLTGIQGNITLAKMNERADAPIKELLKEAEKACNQAKELTNQLLTFSKGGAPITKIASINDLVRESVEFMRTGTNVKCHFSIAEDLANVEIDENQFTQVINNLTINAIQAMPDGGEIDVICENVRIDDSKELPLENGDYVKISIRDYGMGIAKKYLDKIFFPYFTTKTTENQRGRGLGLAASYSIIKQHGGLITVTSKLRHGSTFQIYLPASGKSIETVRTPRASQGTGHGNVLVMDDEEIIRAVAVKFLSRLGYTVATANDGQEALRLYEGALRQNNPFDAVIMDLTIPGGMGGKEAIEKLRLVDPEVKAIVSSGYSNDPVMAQHRKYGFDAVITKPFNLDDLKLVLQNLLN